MTADERFDRIDATLERLSDRMGGLSDKVGGLSGKVEGLSDKVERVSSDLARLTEFTLNFRTEVANKFDIVDQRLEFLGAAVDSLDTRIAPMSKALIASGLNATNLMREQLRDRETVAVVAARLSALEEKVAKLINPAA